jgi:hypothetical protein
MRGDHHAGDVQDADVVSSEALGGPRVEELGVLVALHNGAELPPLFPVRGASENQPLQGSPAGDTKPELIGGERAGLLEKVQKVNQEHTVILKLGIKAVGAFPDLGSGAEGLQAGCKIPSRIGTGSRRVPSREGSLEEERILEPGIFETKIARSRDGGGSRDHEGEMIRGWAREGGERGIGESQVPGMVEKGAVEAGEDGRVAFVGPSIQPVRQGKLEEG